MFIWRHLIGEAANRHGQLLRCVPRQPDNGVLLGALDDALERLLVLPGCDPIRTAWLHVQRETSTFTLTFILPVQLSA